MGTWRPPTRLELLARFRPGDHAWVIDEVLDLMPRGAGFQPRVHGETRVRVVTLTGNPDDHDPLYRVEILDERGWRTGYWAIIRGSNLTEAPTLGWVDRLRALGH